ncbi:MAG: hypothetical protein DRP42_03760 [Tenericutes bacterium]|nr:MAG: hypothetical protein DRP42_03760 [Mycoplasmatota bacterium]
MPIEITQPELTEFVAIVEQVTAEESDYGVQIHLVLDPLDTELKEKMKDTKTQRFHEWIRLSPKATDHSLPEGSIAHQYYKMLCNVEPKAKEPDKVFDAFKTMEGNIYLFRKEKLGRSYGGHEATDHWVVQEKKQVPGDPPTA